MKKIQKLNEELPEFFLESLEERLETDPMSVGSFVDLTDASSDESGVCIGNTSCGENEDCTDFTSCPVNF